VEVKKSPCLEELEAREILIMVFYLNQYQRLDFEEGFLNREGDGEF